MVARMAGGYQGVLGDRLGCFLSGVWNWIAIQSYGWQHTIRNTKVITNNIENIFYKQVTRTGYLTRITSLGCVTQ
jgi:hypothetical protein